MFCTDIPAPTFLIFSNTTPHLLYFSHIPTAIIALLLGFFIYFKNFRNKNGNLLVSKILLFIAILFFFWSILDLILWTNIDSKIIVFVWSIINLAEMLVSSGTLYFSYIFLEKKDAPFKYKVIIGGLLIAFIVFIPTQLNLPGFDLANCEAEQGPLIYYYYFLEILFSLWLIVYLVKKVVAARGEERKMTAYFSIGTVCFLASFSGVNVVSSITEHWEILQYGLFGMPIFMAFLVYLIVRYKVFNIKLLGAEALVAAIVILIGSQFFFIQNPTNRVLTSITLILIIFFGWLLVKSVAREAEQKNKIEAMAEDVKRAYEVEKKAREELQHIDEAKSQFIMATQHHLRTPLTALKGYLSMSLEGDFGDVGQTLKEKLGFCFESTNRLIKLVNEFLDISKLQLGRDILEIKEASISELLQDVIAEVKPEAEKKQVFLNLVLPEGNVPLAMVDSIKFREALYNLTDNAVKYTEKGGVTVKLGMLNKKGKDFLLITITDTGIGMSAEEVKNVFGRQFERGKEAQRVYALGRGIGLYIAASIIRAHKAVIRAESAGPGKGSSFYVELPVKQQAG